MHITQYWSENASTTATLKAACICLTLTTALSSGFVLYLAKRPPLIVERSCFSSKLQTTSGTRTEAEVGSFIHEGIKARFNTKSKNSDLLSVRELRKRLSEQKQFNSKKITQTMLVDSMEIVENKVTVRATRLIALKNVRSALPFHLAVEIKQVRRSADNPYGLVIEDVKELPLGEESKEAQ